MYTSLILPDVGTPTPDRPRIPSSLRLSRPAVHLGQHRGDDDTSDVTRHLWPVVNTLPSRSVSGRAMTDLTMTALSPPHSGVSQHRLELDHLLDAGPAPLPPESALFDPTERGARSQIAESVGHHHTRLDAGHQSLETIGVGRVPVRGQ